MATRAVFAGTPDFAVPCLNAFIEMGIDVVAVYTQPDRPAGRGRKLNACPVKRLAIEAGLQIRQPCDRPGDAILRSRPSPRLRVGG